MAGDVCMYVLCLLGCCMCDDYNTLLSLLLTECECVCVAVGRIVVGGRRLGVCGRLWWMGGVCCVYVWCWAGGYVSTPSPCRRAALRLCWTNCVGEGGGQWGGGGAMGRGRGLEPAHCVATAALPRPALRPAAQFTGGRNFPVAHVDCYCCHTKECAHGRPRKIWLCCKAQSMRKEAIRDTSR